MEHVRAGDGHEVFPGEFLHRGETVRLLGEDLFKEIAHAARVAEGDAAGVFVVNEVPDVLLRVLSERVAALFALHLENGEHFIERVILKVQVAVKTGLKTGVGADEFLHQLIVAGNDHDEVVAVILHRLQEGVDRLLPEVVVAFAVERIRLVDEQHTAERTLDHLLRLDGGLTDVPGDKPAAVDLDKLTLRQDAERVVDARHQTRDHRLARTGVAGEDHVERKIGVGKSRFRTAPKDGRHVDEVVHLALDLAKTDVGVKLRLEILDLLGRKRLRLRFFFCALVAGLLSGRLLLLFRCGGLAAAAGRRSAPKVGGHTFEIVLRHRADDVKLLQNDLVFFIHGRFLPVIASVGYFSWRGTTAPR